MKCKHCQNPETKVLESRESRDGCTIRRRRECVACGYRFTTFERLEERPLSVLKRDGHSELFSRDKLLKSLSVACQKRLIDLSVLQGIVDGIESFVCAKDEKSVTSQQVGELVLRALLKIDPVAYVRFASVYRAFATPEDFIRELELLKTNLSKLDNASEVL